MKKKIIIILGSGSISEAEFRRVLTNQALDCVYVNKKDESFRDMQEKLYEAALNIHCKMNELEQKSYSKFKNYKESYNSKHLRRQFR